MPSFFRILVFFPFMESLNGTVSNTDFPCFKSHNPRKFWQTAMDWEWWRLCRSFISRKASDMSAADGRYQSHVEKYRTISSALLRLFSGWKKSWYKSTAIYINLLNLHCCLSSDSICIALRCGAALSVLRRSSEELKLIRMPYPYTGKPITSK